MVQIIKLRAATEGLTVDETAIQVLGQIGTRFFWNTNRTVHVKAVLVK